jgi:DNA uptake protein ComE-like DNA-binding protein
MRKLTFGLVGLAAILAATPLMAQTPQSSSPTTKPAPAASAPAGSPKSAPAAASAGKSAAEKPAIIDINSASKDELDALPGIGSVRAEAIIKGRPYKGKDELHRKKIIPMNVYDGIKDRIVARQS